MLFAKHWFRRDSFTLAGGAATLMEATDDVARDIAKGSRKPGAAVGATRNVCRCSSVHCQLVCEVASEIISKITCGGPHPFFAALTACHIAHPRKRRSNVERAFLLKRVA